MRSSARTTRCLRGSSSTRAIACQKPKKVAHGSVPPGWPSRVSLGHQSAPMLRPALGVRRHHVTDSNLWCENFTMNRYQRGGVTTCHAGRSSSLKMQVERYGKTDPQSRARSKYIEPEGGRFVPPLKPACSRDKGPDPYGTGDHAKWMISSAGASPRTLPPPNPRAARPLREPAASRAHPPTARLLSRHQATTAAWALRPRTSRCGIRTVCPAAISRCDQRARHMFTETFCGPSRVHCARASLRRRWREWHV